MFNKLFGKKAVERTIAPSEINPAAEAMQRAINEKKKDDPLIGVKIGARDLVQRLLVIMKTEKGVHIESLLSALGSVAGYSCQTSVREEFVKNNKLQENDVFTLVTDKDGKTYYFGDLLNKPLAESQYSVWGLVAGAAQELNIKSLPDLGDIFKYVSETVGSENFGIPRIPANHSPSHPPIEYVKSMYPELIPLLKQYCAVPSEWPILLGLAIQEVLYMSKGVIDPSMAVSIIMESAIPMSKVDVAAL